MHNHLQSLQRIVWKKKKNSQQQLCGWKCLVDIKGQRRMSRLVEGDRTTITQITTCYNQGRAPSLKAQQVELWSRCSTAAQDHTGCHSRQIRRWNRGDYLDRDWRNDTWSDESRFQLLIHMVGSQFGRNNTKASCLASTGQAARGVLVWRIIGPLSTILAADHLFYKIF